MATKTWISNVASTWATAGSWSPAGIPAAGDDVIFNGTNNGQCTVGAVTNTLLSLTTTGYTGNLIVNARLTVGGNMTLSSTNNISGTSDITISTNSVLNPGGSTIGCGLRFSTINTTIQLAGTLTLSFTFVALGTPAGFINLVSSSPGTTRIFNLLNNGLTSQYVDYLNVTDIDSSAACTLWTYKGTVTTSSNWYIMVTQPPPVSSVSFT
jgi:hypothetical protein